MGSFWKSDFGKLFITGCGIQLGLLFALSGLLLILFVCMGLAVTTALTFSVTQSLTSLPAETPVAPPSLNSTSQEAEALLTEIDTLISEIDTLRADALAIQVNNEVVSAEKPLAIATQGEVTLYGGPGVDFGPMGVWPAGTTLEIVGRNSSANWWLVALPNGHFGWVADTAVRVQGVSEALPVAVAPSDLAQPAASNLPAISGPTATSAPSPTPTLPPGTPTPSVALERQFVEDTASYASIKGSLLVPPVSASYSPDGRLIAMTEGVKLYTFKVDGSVPQIWLEDGNELRPLNGAVWSPDGQYIALVVEFKPPRCSLCRAVAILRPADGEITFLEGPNGLQTDAPRWTQDGRLLVNAHPGEPADGVTYVYNVFGEGQPAEGVYTLSSSHDGQKWFRWLPGRIWRAGVTERADSYYHD